MLQYSSVQNKSLEISQWIINSKIEKIENYYGRSLERYKKKLKEVESISSILGIEGTSSKFLFEKIKDELKDTNIKFEGRDYRPPKI